MKTLCLILFFAPLTALGADLTLPQALQQALAHSLTLKKSAALTDASTASLGAARAERWPTLFLSGAAQVIEDIPVVQFPEGIQKELGAKQTYQTDLRLTVPLFTGGKISSGVDLARAFRELQEALAKGDSDRVAFTCWNEYLGLARADQMVEVARTSLRRAEIINADVSSLLAAGVADSIDLNDSRLALSRAKLGVTQAENQRRSAEIRTSILIGADPEKSINPATVLPDPQDTLFYGAVTVADSKSELRAASASESAAKAKVRLTTADFLPSVSAYGGYAYGKPNGDLFSNKWRDYWSAGANLSWSFNLGGRAHSKHKSARYELSSAQSERDRTVEQLDREARLAREQIKLALDRCQSVRTEFQIASDQFRQAQLRHQNGDLSSNRLLDIETSLTAAQSSLTASIADYWLAVAYWYFTIGSDKLQEGF